MERHYPGNMYRILGGGQYSALDKAIKVIIVVLSISTLIAVVVAFTNTVALYVPNRQLSGL